jgi:hypothetical protein
MRRDYRIRRRTESPARRRSDGTDLVRTSRVDLLIENVRERAGAKAER